MSAATSKPVDVRVASIGVNIKGDAVIYLFIDGRQVEASINLVSFARLAHPQRDLYYKHVSEDLGLTQMTQAVLADDDGWGLFPEYRFKGEDKNAAFHLCSSPLAGGFGWVVGVGIDNDDIYATS